jgi:hypothetical protein
LPPSICFSTSYVELGLAQGQQPGVAIRIAWNLAIHGQRERVLALMELGTSSPAP